MVNKLLDLYLRFRKVLKSANAQLLTTRVATAESLQGVGNVVLVRRGHGPM